MYIAIYAMKWVGNTECACTVITAVLCDYCQRNTAEI